MDVSQITVSCSQLQLVLPCHTPDLQSNFNSISPPTPTLEHHFTLRSSIQLLGAFTKLRKANISLVVSVHPSVRMEKLGSHEKDFREI